jgi:putative heme-binding domain-containing protein
VELAASSRIPLVRRFLVRRLTEEVEKSPAPVSLLLQRARKAPAASQRDVLQGMAEALRGWRKAKAPEGWADLQAKLAGSRDAKVRELVRELGVVFGDGRALDEVTRIALNGSADGESRRAALRVLIEGRAPGLRPVLQRLVSDRATAGLAVRGLAAYDHPDTPRLILDNYHFLRPEDRVEAINTLTARPAYARALLKAVGAGRLPRGELSAYQARQIHSLGDETLNRELTRVWGEIRGTPADKRKLIARYKSLLTRERLKGADLPAGRVLYNKLCASCHVLYGQGKPIGPDLTGSNRDNLDYLLENIVDPSAVVPADFRMSVVTLKDGRVLTGVVGGQAGRTLAVQTQTEQLTVERSEVESVRPTPQSLMPDGLLGDLRDEQVRDLIAYLMSPRQAPLPEGAARP